MYFLNLRRSVHSRGLGLQVNYPTHMVNCVNIKFCQFTIFDNKDASSFRSLNKALYLRPFFQCTFKSHQLGKFFRILLPRQQTAKNTNQLVLETIFKLLNSIFSKDFTFVFCVQSVLYKHIQLYILSFSFFNTLHLLRNLTFSHLGPHNGQLHLEHFWEPSMRSVHPKHIGSYNKSAQQPGPFVKMLIDYKY